MSEIVDIAEARKRLRPSGNSLQGTKIDLMASFVPENVRGDRLNTADTVPTLGNELSLPFRDPSKGTAHETPRAPAVNERSDEAFEAAMMREFGMVFEPDEL